ncbi:hypothetical protein [Convivina praedatoris]|uniref:Uncharacterized protein n=1 Tax=Convivina praedatoris TaxID=2880963 RepID=A0ABM9D1A4_9LACO|nr:hypothetical protein [Convivina sp. LMG 32447]CAH1849928.1 hypothetical protein R077815_00018 [Convivina sp. LMG 32447]CAH1849932.1 hypothetical protein LMG032447_00020 [Convivina sp. LMG 32447]CAH1851314.1 hypothetical protein R078138_00312 [Convivina sp. LMG 32447]
MKFLDNLKALWQDVKTIQQQSQRLSDQVNKLQTQLNIQEKKLRDLNNGVKRMNFKNKPHLDRIQATSEHLEQELAKYGTNNR